MKPPPILLKKSKMKNGKTRRSTVFLTSKILTKLPSDILAWMTLSDIWNKACSEGDIEEKWINATLCPSQEFAIKQDEGKKQQTTEEIVPPEYHEYLDVFQEEVERFPKARSWDHAVDMKPVFEPRSFKSYNLTLEK